MATFVAPTLVPAPPRIALPYGLFSVLAFRTGGRWEMGVTWESLPCEPAAGRGNDDCDPETPVIGLPKQFPVGNETQQADPFTVIGSFKCGPIGWGTDAAEERATQHLTTREEARVEQAVWTGDLGNTPSLQEDGVLINATVFPIEVGIARLEQYIAREYGSLGVIHMSRVAASVGLAEKALETVGGRLQTLLGTPVVAGTGYTGDGPDGVAPGVNQTYIYATPALFGYRSDIFTGQTTDTALNDLYALAERNYLVGWDDCGVGAVLVGLPLAPAAASGPPPGTPLSLLLGTIPGSPVEVGTDVTVNVQSNEQPDDEVHLHVSDDAGATWTDLGEMTEIGTTEFVYNRETATAGSFWLRASSGTTWSPTIVLEVTA